MINLMYEDELPEMTDEEYSEWFDKSLIVYGVRMGPQIIGTNNDLVPKIPIQNKE